MKCLGHAPVSKWDASTCRLRIGQPSHHAKTGKVIPFANITFHERNPISTKWCCIVESVPTMAPLTTKMLWQWIEFANVNIFHIFYMVIWLDHRFLSSNHRKCIHEQRFSNKRVGDKLVSKLMSKLVENRFFFQIDLTQVSNLKTLLDLAVSPVSRAGNICGRMNPSWLEYLHCSLGFVSK